MAQDDTDRGRPIGAIAEATGLTVRTLHYYEEIGLLAPGRTAAGHRPPTTCCRSWRR